MAYFNCLLALWREEKQEAQCRVLLTSLTGLTSVGALGSCVRRFREAV